MIIGLLAIAMLVVNIRQPQIFTVVTSIGIIMIYVAYLLVTLPMLVARLRGQWQPREGRFSLGRWGLPVNILAVLWGGAMTLNLAWPRDEVYNASALPLVSALGRGPVRRRRSRSAASPTTGSSSGTVPACSPSTPRVDAGPRPADRARPPREESERAAREPTRVRLRRGRRRHRGHVVAAAAVRGPRRPRLPPGGRPVDVGDDDILQLNRWMGLLESGYDWDYPVEPQESGNSFMRHARAKVLGGCPRTTPASPSGRPPRTSTTGPRRAVTGWSADDLLPAVPQLETDDAPRADHHGRTAAR